QVASSATSGGTPPAGVLGTHVALGGFRGKCHSLDSRRTRRAPGCGLRVRHSGTWGMFRRESFGLTFGTRGVFRRKDRRVWFEGVSKGAFGEMASGLASGTDGALRRTVRQGFWRKLRKEAFGL